MRKLFQTRQDKWRDRQRREDLSWNKEAKIIRQCSSCDNKSQGEIDVDGYWTTQCKDYQKAVAKGYCKNHRTEEENKFLRKNW